MTPVILSGGSGTRLWPLSTAARPKQFIALTEAQTMLQLTAARVAREGVGAPIVVGNGRHVAMIREQLAAVGQPGGTLICEPMARNTAPAIALAALAAPSPDTPLLVMPSDHVIADVDAFHAAIARALPLVADGWLCTFGIEPTGPEIGYGYIAMGDAIAEGAHQVARFIEKPPLAEAQAMLAAGGYAWNAGIFLFRADRYLDALRLYAPAMVAAAEAAMAGARRESDRAGATEIYPDADAFAGSPSDSIDYAVMEKDARVAVIPVAMGWSDVGSWEALHAIAERDDNDNALAPDTIAIDSSGCLVRSSGPKVSLVGVHDLVILVENDHVVVLPRSASQRVKELAGQRDGPART